MKREWRTGNDSLFVMKYIDKRSSQSGKLGWIFLWLIGIPVPVLIILFLLRGCT